MTVPLLFIVGVGRSGTSLLQSMLASHPDVAYLPETIFLRRYIPRGRLQAIYEKQGKQAVEQALEADEYFFRTGLDPANIVSRAIEHGSFLDASIYLEMLAAYTCDSKNWVGDKDPRAIEYLPLLKSVAPDSLVLHILRDPRDVLASKKKAAWSKKGHVWKHVFANRVQFTIGSRRGPDLFGKRYHEICYEELLSAPEKVLSGLCRDLGLEYDKGMLSFGNAARKLVADREMSWKKETLGPLLTENRAKWKTGLHPREVLLTELCCGQAMARGGYKKDQRSRRLSLKDRLWVQAGRLLIVMATWPYIQYRNFRIRRACRRLR